jgi:rare lipoprotein A
MKIILIGLLVVLICGCSSPPINHYKLGKDSAEANPPPNLDKIPDATPKVEVIVKGGANKEYEVLGQRYQPVIKDEPISEKGIASWYGVKYNGHSTSNGEIYDMYSMSAAHKTMPLPSFALVKNPKNKKMVIVRVNDRGPFHENRIIDLSYSAALKLDLIKNPGEVEVRRITNEEIKNGTWKKLIPN